MSDRPGPPKRGRRLSQEELSLWKTVAGSVRAAPKSGRTPPPDAADAKTGSPEQNAARRKAALKNSVAAQLPIVPKRFAPQAAEPPSKVTAARSPIDPLGARTPGLDKRTAKRLSRGEHAPDARIDLHGMTAERAHGALVSFILREQTRGARCVLVITGKGRRDDRDPTWRQGGAGVLKTMTPEWLRQPPCGPLVVGVYQAHQRHGGAGALYVYLRKRR